MGVRWSPLRSDRVLDRAGRKPHRAATGTTGSTVPTGAARLMAALPFPRTAGRRAYRRAANVIPATSAPSPVPTTTWAGVWSRSSTRDQPTTATSA